MAPAALIIYVGAEQKDKTQGRENAEENKKCGSHFKGGDHLLYNGGCS
jgi:hypothetical protein